MKCNNCGHDLDENVKFCDKCGASVDGTSAPPQTIPASAKKKPSLIVQLLGTVFALAFVALFIFGNVKLISFLVKQFKDDGSTEVGQGDKRSLLDVLDDPDKYASATSEIDAANSKKFVTEEVTKADELDSAVNADNDDEEYVYPTKLIGLTVNEMIDLIGEPQMIERNYLGGGGHDTAYIYGNYTNIFIASYPPESNYNFDDRDAIINVAIVLGGDVNEYVYVDMPYSVLSETYSLSEPVLFNGGDAMLDGKYVSTSNITCNGLKCNMLAASYENGSNAPMELFMITANDLRN